MAENKEFINKNPELPDSVIKNQQKVGDYQQKVGDYQQKVGDYQQKVEDYQKKEEINPPEKPNVVTVPAPAVVPPPPVKAEINHPGKFVHPAIRWPLYALGGFLIIRWAWKKWRPDDDETKK